MALEETPQPLVRTIHVGQEAVLVEVADTPALRERGLSGRAPLAPHTGMLFVFDTDGRWGIWMKDMRFAIDIVWLDGRGAVVGVVQNAAPDSYPQIFSPDKPARYVLELPAGFVAEHEIEQGDRISF